MQLHVTVNTIVAIWIAGSYSAAMVTIAMVGTSKRGVTV